MSNSGTETTRASKIRGATSMGSAKQARAKSTRNTTMSALEGQALRAKRDWEHANYMWSIVDEPHLDAKYWDMAEEAEERYNKAVGKMDKKTAKKYGKLTYTQPNTRGFDPNNIKAPKPFSVGGIEV